MNLGGGAHSSSHADEIANRAKGAGYRVQGGISSHADENAHRAKGGGGTGRGGRAPSVLVPSAVDEAIKVSK